MPLVQARQTQPEVNSGRDIPMPAIHIISTSLSEPSTDPITTDLTQTLMPNLFDSNCLQLKAASQMRFVACDELLLQSIADHGRQTVTRYRNPMACDDFAKIAIGSSD